MLTAEQFYKQRGLSKKEREAIENRILDAVGDDSLIGEDNGIILPENLRLTEATIIWLEKNGWIIQNGQMLPKQLQKTKASEQRQRQEAEDAERQKRAEAIKQRQVAEAIKQRQAAEAAEMQRQIEAAAQETTQSNFQDDLGGLQPDDC